MKSIKRVLALSLALMMVMSSVVFADFTDEDDIPSQNREAVALLEALNIMNGYEDGSFRPDGNITRAEAAKMVYVLCNNGVDDGADIYKDQDIFSDLRADAWYIGYVNYCANVGIIAGRGNGTFDPEGLVTSYELMKMLLVVAEYKPDIQGYTGSTWQANVLRDAQSSGMLKGFEYSMTAAAPRHWAARLFYNTILDVDAALYIGDMLITNPNLVGGSEKVWNTVGLKRLGLKYSSAEVTGTYAARLGVGADTYSTSVLSPAYSSASRANRNDTSISKNLEVKYDIPNEYLGREVRVVYKLINENIEANAGNIVVYSVYPTGNDEVVEVTINDIETTYDTTGTKDEFTVKFAGFNNGRKTKGDFKVVLPARDYLVEAFSGYAYKNDFEYVELPDVGAAGIDSEDYAKYWGGFSGDTVKFVIDSNGDIRNIFITETNYYKVVGQTSSKYTFQTNTGTTGVLTLDKDDVKTSDTIAQDDVVAIVEDYGTGEVVYNVRKIDSTSVSASDYSTTDKTVTLNGDAYGLNLRAASNTLDKDHAVYYLDAGTVVYSDDATGSASLPSDVAIIVDVTPNGKIVESTVGKQLYWSVTVQYLTADGKKVTALYDVEEAIKNNDDLFVKHISMNILDYKATGVLEGNPGGAGTGFLYGVTVTAGDPVSAQLSDAVQAYMANMVMVKVNTTSNGVYFKEYTDYPNALMGTTYNDKTMEMKVGANTYLMTGESTVFARYERNASGEYKYTVIKGSALKTYRSTTSAQVVGDSKANVRGTYIDFGTAKLPVETAVRTYFVLTGNASETKVGTTWRLSVEVVDMDGNTKYVPVDTAASKALFFTPQVGGSDKTLELTEYQKIVDGSIDTTADGLKLTLVEYTVASNGLYTLIPQNASIASATISPKFGQITAAGSDFIVIAGSRATVTEDTAIFYTVEESGTDKIYAYSSPMTFTKDPSTLQVAYAAVDNDGYVTAIYVNGNGTNVQSTPNIYGTAGWLTTTYGGTATFTPASFVRGVK